MRRIRTIKPEWLEDERLAAADDEARVASVALMLIADDYGRGRAHPKYLASEIWKYAEDTRETLARVSRALASLSAIGFVVVYEVEGQRYFEIVNWSKHQKVDRPSKPRIPARLDAPLEEIRETLASPRETLATDHGPRTMDQDRDRGAGAVHTAREPSTDPSDLGLLPTAPVPAKVLGALVRGYRDAFEAKYQTMPTDIRTAEADGAVFAIQARASVTGQDPVAIAGRAAGFWLESRDPWDGNPRKLPRWKYFLSDLGGVLTQVPAAEAAQ